MCILMEEMEYRGGNNLFRDYYDYFLFDNIKKIIVIYWNKILKL